MKEIIDDSRVYSDWHAALSSINGIDLITDTKTENNMWAQHMEIKDYYNAGQNM